jgi:hypothetical protein
MAIEASSSSDVGINMPRELLAFEIYLRGSSGILTMFVTTAPSFQSAKLSVTFAVPLPASFGTRTGPRNKSSQHR